MKTPYEQEIERLEKEKFDIIKENDTDFILNIGLARCVAKLEGTKKGRELTLQEVKEKIKDKLDLLESLLDDVKEKTIRFVNISEHSGEMRTLINQLKKELGLSEGNVK